MVVLSFFISPSGVVSSLLTWFMERADYMIAFMAGAIMWELMKRGAKIAFKHMSGKHLMVCLIVLFCLASVLIFADFTFVVIVGVVAGLWLFLKLRSRRKRALALGAGAGLGAKS